MIKAYSENVAGSGKLLIGVSDENDKRMRHGSPMFFNLKEISSELPDLHICIVRDKNEFEITRKYLGK